MMASNDFVSAFDDFEDAVIFARDQLQQMDFFPTPAEDFAQSLLNALNNRGEDRALHSVIAGAEKERLTFDALQVLAAGFLERGEHLPVTLRAWTAGVLRGELKRPTHNKNHLRAWPDEHLRRDLLIHRLVEELVSEGFKATRNDASLPNSACDVVANAMKHERRTPASYSEVKRIFLNVDKRIRSGPHPALPLLVIYNRI